MRGKIVNLCIGCMNIVLGILLLVYTAYIPQDIAEFTLQELTVVNGLLKGIYVALVLVFIIDVFQYHNNRDNSRLKTGYLLGFFCLSFFFIKEPAISIFSILSGIIIIVETIKDTVVEMDSTTGISVVAFIIVAMVIMIGVCIFYQNIGQYIKNRANKDSQEYTSDYFKYVTELEITDVYINVKKDGKYGYINQNGEVVIDFKYDYASPFVNITMYNKDFQVALVCEDGTSYIIMKNERQVMSYYSESTDDNYEAKMEELEDIYKNTLGQSGNMETEIQCKTDCMQRAERYYETEASEDYTYRYDYNDEYDILITQSNLGLGDKYELAKKDNLNIRITLDCADIDYDEEYVYLYSNGTIPFFDISSKEQGWFTSYGKKNVMSGRAQILDFIGERILIRNYNNDTIYFINSDGDIVSDVYQDIYVGDNVFIVKNSDDRYQVLDEDLNPLFETQYDVIDPTLAEYGLYICTNTDEAIEFNDYSFAEMNWQLVNSSGEVILDGIEQIYGNYYQISKDKDVAYVTRYEEFLEDLKDIDFSFVGDKFYSVYTN